MRSDARIAAIVVVATAATVLVGTAVPARAQQPQAALLNGLDRDVACAPASPLVRPATPLTVIAGRDRYKTSFAVGDAVIIRGGTAQGLKAGDEFFVRRVVDDKATEGQAGVYPISIHAAGAVQIVEAQADASIAVVTYNCDAITEGDYLERYQRPVTPTAQVGTTPGLRASRPADSRRRAAADGDARQLHGRRPWQRPRPASRAADHGVPPDRRWRPGADRRHGHRLLGPARVVCAPRRHSQSTRCTSETWWLFTAEAGRRSAGPGCSRARSARD